MTERAVWLRLAAEFSKPRLGRKFDFNSGLCLGLVAVKWNGVPGDATENQANFCRRIHERMRRKISRALRPGSRWLAPRSDAGDKVRVRFCKRMAAQLERKPRKRSGRAEVRR